MWRSQSGGGESPAALFPTLLFFHISGLPHYTLASYLWPLVFLVLGGGAESLRPALPLLPSARAWRLSLLAITLIVIMTPVATILRKINLHSNPLISCACAPPCATWVRRVGSLSLAVPEAEIRPHWRGSRRTETVLSGTACELPKQPGEPGKRGAGLGFCILVATPTQALTWAPSFPLWDTPSTLGCVKGQTPNLIAHLSIGAFFLTLHPLGARQKCKGS